MFITKHTNIIYNLYYNDSNGKRKKVSTRKRLNFDVYKFLLNLKSQQENNPDSKLREITLKKFIFEYLIYSQSIHSQNTANKFKTTSNSLISYFGDISLSVLTHLKKKEFNQDKIKTVSKYQARKDLINLSSALNKA